MAQLPTTRFLVVLDVDSTLIENEVIELLAAAAGSHDRVAEITYRAMNGELDFEASLRARVATLAGLPVSVFDTVAEQIRYTQGVREMTAGVHAGGGKVGVVSGGFHELVDPLAQELGLDFWCANRLAVENGELTGGLIGEIIDSQAKARVLRGWAQDCGVPLAKTVAVGDGANDLTMMGTTGLSVAFDAKAPVRDEADLIMDIRDLTQLLPLLGLRG